MTFWGSLQISTAFILEPRQVNPSEISSDISVRHIKLKYRLLAGSIQNYLHCTFWYNAGLQLYTSLPQTCCSNTFQSCTQPRQHARHITPTAHSILTQGWIAAFKIGH
ncbi:hypothetical protein ATANTOWER_008456 [Ataeniobius toweri]|uniref:Uncharacterized protein n=1 Tax=Ataeniobius toweri TaxID=208326 RepID=A0ABU7AN04_9TELE|nr:hypothetical protein [Ataeniobius toweri]